MASNNAINENEVIIEAESHNCPNCNGTMKHDTVNGKFLCTSCGHEEIIDTDSANVFEYRFNNYIERESQSIAFEGLASVECKSCGAKIVFDGHEIAKICPMCSSTQIAAVKQQAGIPPEGVVPFLISKSDATQKSKAWVKRIWFAPNKFKKKYQEGKLDGYYVPFWTYDSFVKSYYDGQGGNRRTVVKKDKDGKEIRKTVIDWYSTSGYVNDSFNDLLICAADDSEKKLIENIEPFDTINNIKPYSSSYLSGYNAELYSIKADTAFETAKDEMNDHMMELARRDILTRYDEANVYKVSSTFYDVTYKHVLLPVWKSVFFYNGKNYRYVVNGETGKVYGERPYSPVKITLAIIAALIIALCLYMLFTGKGFDELFSYAADHISAFKDSYNISDTVGSVFKNRLT